MSRQRSLSRKQKDMLYTSTILYLCLDAHSVFIVPWPRRIIKLMVLVMQRPWVSSSEPWEHRMSHGVTPTLLQAIDERHRGRHRNGRGGEVQG